MAISSLTLEEIEIPFKQSFSHASATRKTTESIVVKAQSVNGLTGYGEGCPRSYVTGETLETARGFFYRHKADIENIDSLAQLKSWVEGNTAIIDLNPAAWCAVELAILDMLGKEQQQTVEQLLCLPTLSGRFLYTAVLGAAGIGPFTKQLAKYVQSGFQSYKIKIVGDQEEDLRKITALRELGRKIDVRLDANNLWDHPKQAIDYIKALDYPFVALEEPLKRCNYAACQAISKTMKLPIILDESFLRLEQFDYLTQNPQGWIVNLRVSKMGGILRSLAVADKAKELGIPVIIGAHVGETSILTRAALTLANAYRPLVIAQEGAFGTHLLARDIANPSLIFGVAGKLDISPGNKSSGFGLDIKL